MTDIIKVPCVIPSSENARVYKEECIFCFQTPEHDGGLYVCLVSHFGYCLPHLMKMTQMHETDGNTFGNGGYLHIQRIRRTKKKETSESEPKLAKLAIGVEGGLQEAQFSTDETFKLAVFPGPTLYNLDDPRLEETVRICCDNIIVGESADRMQQLESLAGTWDGSSMIPTKHVDLPQLTPAPKIPPTGWRCQADGCDKTENLWMNLTDGKIFCGRRNFDGSGGNDHAVVHYEKTGYPLAVKLGTITAEGADVYSYSEDDMVFDRNLQEHLAHFGIDMAAMKKTEKTMLELQLDLNRNYEFSRLQETGRELTPIYGPGYTGLVNLGSTCYMNSALQTLALIPEVNRVFTGNAADRIFYQFLTTRPAGTPSDSFQLQFAKLFDGLMSGRFSKKPPENMENDMVSPDSAVRPQTFRSLVGRGHPEFSSPRQQDVEEYLRWLCEKLEHQKDIGADSILAAFRFEALEHSHFDATGEALCERHPETILSLPVPVEKAVNLAEVQQFETKRKEVEAAGGKMDNVVYPKIPIKACLDEFANPCVIEKVQSPSDPEVSTSLRRSHYMASFPDYLLVQFKKFTVADDWTPKKLGVEIVLEDELNVEQLGVPEGLEGKEVDKTKQKDTNMSPEELDAVTNLVNAGFPMNASKKAWRLSGGRMDAAFDWLLTHSGDPDFNEPQTSAPALSPLISHITSMGFTPDQARKALRLSNAGVEQAIEWLLEHPNDPGEPEGAQQSAQSTNTQQYRNGPGLYRLIGFISHMGASTHSGHYVCHLLKKIKGKGEQWVIYNDEKVALSENPPKGFGYVYLYERVK